jgi:hypothetical protein
MKRSSIFVVVMTCTVIILLFLLYDHLPLALNSMLGDALLPGFFFAILINGSLHDRIIPGYVAIAATFDCIFYSALALGVVKLLSLRKTG